MSDFSQNQISNAISLELIPQKHVVTLTFELPMSEIHVHSNNELAMLFTVNHIINKIPNKGSKSIYMGIEKDQMNLVLDFMKTYYNRCLNFKNIKVNLSFFVIKHFLKQG